MTTFMTFCRKKNMDVSIRKNHHPLARSRPSIVLISGGVTFPPSAQDDSGTHIIRFDMFILCFSDSGRDAAGM
jgi:hypothetical protein